MSEFFSMGGYGLFIWPSFGITFLLMIGEVIYLRRQHRTILQRLGRMVRMNKEVNS